VPGVPGEQLVIEQGADRPGLLQPGGRRPQPSAQPEVLGTAGDGYSQIAQYLADLRR